METTSANQSRPVPHDPMVKCARTECNVRFIPGQSEKRRKKSPYCSRRCCNIECNRIRRAKIKEDPLLSEEDKIRESGRMEKRSCKRSDCGKEFFCREANPRQYCCLNCEKKDAPKPVYPDRASRVAEAKRIVAEEPCPGLEGEPCGEKLDHDGIFVFCTKCSYSFNVKSIRGSSPAAEKEAGPPGKKETVEPMFSIVPKSEEKPRPAVEKKPSPPKPEPDTVSQEKSPAEMRSEVEIAEALSLLSRDRSAIVFRLADNMREQRELLMELNK